MTVETKELEAFQVETEKTGIVLLPNGLSNDPESRDYSSTAISFAKYAAGSGAEVPVNYYVLPAGMVERRSGDWFSPVMLITAQLVAEHPLIANVVCGLITNFIYDTFKGASKPELHIEVVVETKGKSKKKFVRVNYQGKVDNIEELAKAIKEITGDGQT